MVRSNPASGRKEGVVTHHTPTPDRPEGWSMADEGYKKVIRMDYHGQPYEVWEKPLPDLGKAWAKWRAQQQWLGGGLDHSKEQQTLIDIENYGL